MQGGKEFGNPTARRCLHAVRSPEGSSRAEPAPCSVPSPQRPTACDIQRVLNTCVQKNGCVIAYPAGTQTHGRFHGNPFSLPSKAILSFFLFLAVLRVYSGLNDAPPPKYVLYPGSCEWDLI